MYYEDKKQLLYLKYKPLRNHLRKIGLSPSIFVVWNYIRHLHSGTPFNFDVEVIKEYVEADGIQKRRLISEWELEVLLREIYIEVIPLVYEQETLKKWNYFSTAINKLKDISSEISKLFISNDNILIELHRIAHNQFPWQLKNPTERYFSRYYKIFSHDMVSPLIEEKLKISIKDFYTMALVLWGFYSEKVAIDYPPQIQIAGLDLEKLKTFLNFLSLNLEELRPILKKSRNVDETFFYSFNPLRKFPLIIMNYFGKMSLVCPDATLLFWRVTDGIYYEICKEDGFSLAFGKSFQDYTGEVLSKASPKLKIYPEAPYGSSHSRKESVDWIADDEHSILFIECKTKRMQNESKVQLLNLNKLEEDLEKMADFVVQIYKNIRDYKAGEYEHYTHDKNKNIYPIVVTLENWMLMGPLLFEKLNLAVQNKMKIENLPIIWLEEIPYSICAMDTFEDLMQVINQKNIKTVLNEKLNDKEKKIFDFDPFLRTSFPEEMKKVTSLFSDEFEDINFSGK